MGGLVVGGRVVEGFVVGGCVVVVLAEDCDVSALVEGFSVEGEGLVISHGSEG